MRKSVCLFTIFVLIMAFLSNCAKRGRPEGGPKDEDAPIMILAKPAHLTTNFKEDEIKIYFDEYVKLKDLQKQLIVSPPLKYTPIIKPLGTPSKYISIKILDTLKENTTYTFNFGESVIDNTEGNALHNFKYVFSTGDIIDSLKVSGSIKDAFDKETDENITVMLYEVNGTFKDSTIYREKPLYVASTLDTTAWEITNIKAGNYLLMALKDVSKNYLFNPKEDKIGYLKEYVSVPKDSSNHILKLFYEELPFKLTKPSEVSKGHLLFGYEGVADSLKVEAFSISEKFESISYFEKDADTLNLWFKDNIKDSIQFHVSNKEFQDTVTVRLRNNSVDSLKIEGSSRGTLHLRDQFKLISNIPIRSIDTSKISFTDKDTIDIVHTLNIGVTKNEIGLNFVKANVQKYKFELLPGAITDFFGNVNDTLTFQLATKKPADYGSLFLTLQNIDRYPVIVQLIKEKGELIEEVYAEKEQEYIFKNLVPAKYLVRIIYDDNKNKKWDTGNFLIKKQPEEVLYFETVLDIRANWEMTETFILK